MGGAKAEDELQGECNANGGAFESGVIAEGTSCCARTMQGCALEGEDVMDASARTGRSWCGKQDESRAGRAEMMRGRGRDEEERRILFGLQGSW